MAFMWQKELKFSHKLIAIFMVSFTLSLSPKQHLLIW